jgi:hypothetical protein
MNRHFFVPALLLSAVFVSVGTEARDLTEDPAKMIQEASGVILDRAASDKQMQGALVRLLDAAILTLPQSVQTADATSNLEAARAEFKNHSVFSETGYRHLSQAYRALNAGKDFQFPSVHSMEEARTHIQKLVNASVDSLDKGQSGLASRLLLESIIMVITPISR